MLNTNYLVVRTYLGQNFKSLRAENPEFPFALREAAPVEAAIVARFGTSQFSSHNAPSNTLIGRGVEVKTVVADKSAAEVEKALEALITSSK